MASRELQSKPRYILAFVIGTFIFLIGFAVTYAISYVELNRINNLQNRASYEIFSDSLSYSLFDKDICNVETFSKISRDLGFHGRIIDDLEKKFGKNDKMVLERKEFYTLVELEHFDFVRSRNSECESYVNTIIFFYSNKPENIDKGERLGEILSVLHNKNQNLVIYSLDIDMDNYLINELKKKYNVSQPNILIINENVTLTGVRFSAEVEKFLL